MSNSPSTDSSQSPSLLSNLRHFRFQKKQMPTLAMSNNSLTNTTEDEKGSENERIDSPPLNPAGLARGNCIASESGDSPDVATTTTTANSSSPNKAVVTSMALEAMKDSFHLIKTEILEKALIKCNGDVAAAKQFIKTECKPPYSSKYSFNHQSSAAHVNKSSIVQVFKTDVQKALNNGLEKLNKSNTTQQPKETDSTLKRKNTQTVDDCKKVKKARKDKRKLAEYEESGDSDGEDVGFSRQEKKVYDSDEDSDIEISDNMNIEQRQVYDFLCNATLGELLLMPNISQKKAEVIIEQRPFSGWKNMVEKFQEGKGLGTEILNSAQDVLYTRQVVNQLMQKCSRLAVEMERAVSAGASSVTMQPALLNPSLQLAGYQLVGLNWLLVINNRGLNGILADEMGLGKTVQIISLLAHLKERAQAEGKESSGTHLIIVPSSTMDNWNNELSRWCPSLKVMLYYGSLDERKLMRVRISTEGIDQFDVILTTYKLITSTPEERKMYRVLPFNYVIFDEAHMLKNMNTQRFEHLMLVNARHRLLLTGTPLQNNLLELMSLLTFVMPDMFAKKRQYLKCLFTRNPKTTKIPEIKPNATQPKFEQEQVANAKRIMQPFVLRRLKKDVLKDLPIKTEEVRYCPMADRQCARYKELISTYSKRAEDRNNGATNVDEVSGMTMMMDLRKLSNHPLLLRQLYIDAQLSKMAAILSKDPGYKGTNVEYIKEDLSLFSDFQLHTLAKSFRSLSEFELDSSEIVRSGKFEQLDKILPSLQEENHRVLIFSQFVMMLDVMEEYLNVRGHKYLRLDGSTPVTIRQELIDTYNNDPSILVFMLSTRAGGLGINLTAADTVIIHDIDFNPYNDKQAEDRCHRVGQHRPVTVMRFITRDSIEEGIYQVALDKLSLEKEISSEENEHSEARSVVRLLKKTLGLDGPAKSSPVKKPS